MKINGQSVQCVEDATILEIATAAGIRIPTLCHRRGLRPAGGCGVCIVEDIVTGATMPACATAAVETLEISTCSEKVRQIRSAALELLLSDHPADCDAPCQMACPSALPVQEMLEYAASGRWEDAERIARQYPFVCGEQRDQSPCEKVCRRSRLGGSVAICAIHRALCGEKSAEPETRERRRRRAFRSRMKGLADGALRGLAAETGVRIYSGATPIARDLMVYEAKRCLKCGCERPDDCELRDLCEEFTIIQPAYTGTSRAIHRECGPGGFRFDSSRCVLCNRCVRTAGAMGAVIGPACHGRGFDARIGPPLGRTWNDIESATLAVCVAACPTGAMAMVVR